MWRRSVRVLITRVVSWLINTPAISGGSRAVKVTSPSGSLRHVTERCSCWWRSSSASLLVRCSHAAIARGSAPAGTPAAIAASCCSFSGVAMRDSVRTLLYDSSSASNRSAISGSTRSRRPTRIHSLAVHTSRSAMPAIQCAADTAPVAAHSPDSAKSAARPITVRWLVDQVVRASFRSFDRRNPGGMGLVSRVMVVAMRASSSFAGLSDRPVGEGLGRARSTSA